jgi:hypothetical protein
MCYSIMNSVYHEAPIKKIIFQNSFDTYINRKIIYLIPRSINGLVELGEKKKIIEYFVITVRRFQIIY